MGVHNGRMCWVLLSSLAIIVLGVFGTGVTLFFLNVNNKSTFKPYASDRFMLPFPPLFDEFELDGQLSLKSPVSKSRGNAEVCYRRVAPEYETYISGRNGVFDYVSPKKFTVDGEMPPGWLSYTMLDAAVMVILDGARADYGLFDPTLKPNEPRAVFTNHMPVYHEYLTAPETRNHTRFFRFEAPTPTFTVFSLKCVFTGETRRGNMMAQSTSVQHLGLDNMGYQIYANGSSVCTLGDIIAYKFMGPDRVFLNYTGHGTDIFDMERPDSFVTEHYKECITQCDLSFLHLLAIDHLGHAGKRLTPAMTYYMDDYDAFMRKVISEASYRKNSMIFILGDHGQKTNGSHGGGTKEEVDSFLFVKSDLEMPKSSQDHSDLNDAPRGYATDHNVLNGNVSLSYPINKSAHVNLAVTISLLMNKPIPFHTEGVLIKDIVPLIKDTRGNVNKLLSMKYVAQLLHLVAHQMLRTIDTTVSKEDKVKYERMYAAITQERMALSHYYSFVRSMGREQVAPAVMLDIVSNYAAQCERLVKASSKLLKVTNMAMTPEFIVSAIMLMALAWILSIYLALALYHLNCVSKLSGTELALIESQGHLSINPILLRVYLKSIAAMITAAVIVIYMEYFGTTDSNPTTRNHKAAINFFKWILRPFERYCGIENQPPIFYFLVYLLITFVWLFLFDIPFLLRRLAVVYRNYMVYDTTLPQGNFNTNVSRFLSNVSLGNTIWMIMMLYVVLVVKTLVSQCAILSHDTLLRHVVVFCLYLSVFPGIKRMGSLAVDSAYLNFGMVCLVLKICYLIHYFVPARDIGGMLPDWYVKVNIFLRTFETGATALTIFFAALVYLLSRSKDPRASIVTPTFRRELYTTPTNNVVFYVIWSIQYVVLLFHYAVKCERHLFWGPLVNWLSMKLVNARNVVVAKTILGVYSARTFAMVVLLVWIIFACNPWSMLYPSNDSRHYRSTRLFWCIVNMLWSTFLLNGPVKSMGTLMFALILYNVVTLLVKLQVRTRATYVLVILLTCDLMYFVAGHQDSVFELDFDSAFLFFDEYKGYLSEVPVLFAFAIFNATAIFTLYYTFVLLSERDYVVPKSEMSGEHKSGTTDIKAKQSVNLRSWVSSDLSTVVAGYTFMASTHMLFVLSALYALSENICAITDFVPKGVFSVGKTVINMWTFWVIHAASSFI